MAVTQTLAMAWLDTEVHIKTHFLTDRAHYKFGEARECQLWKRKALDNDWLKQRICLFMEEKITKYFYKNLNLKALNISQEN